MTERAEFRNRFGKITSGIFAWSSRLLSRGNRSDWKRKLWSSPFQNGSQLHCIVILSWIPWNVKMFFEFSCCFFLFCSPFSVFFRQIAVFREIFQRKTPLPRKGRFRVRIFRIRGYCFPTWYLSANTLVKVSSILRSKTSVSSNFGISTKPSNLALTSSWLTSLPMRRNSRTISPYSAGGFSVMAAPCKTLLTNASRESAVALASAVTRSNSSSVKRIKNAFFIAILLLSRQGVSEWQPLTSELWYHNSVLAKICPTPITPCRIHHHTAILKRGAKKEKALQIGLFQWLPRSDLNGRHPD